MKFFGVPISTQLFPVERLTKNQQCFVFANSFCQHGAMKSIGLHGGDPPKDGFFMFVGKMEALARRPIEALSEVKLEGEPVAGPHIYKNCQTISD